jgi:tetratricopeptide (TPR) repeat protein
MLQVLKFSGQQHQLRWVLLALLWLPVASSVYAQTPTDANQAPSSTPAPTPSTPAPSIPPAPIPDSSVLNPLEPQPDPLVPEDVINRPLSPQEKDVLRAALDELQRQAEAKLQAGDLPGALELWNRELRLRRYLSPKEEVTSLQQVGEVAWRENQATELRFITLRLQQIEQEATAPPKQTAQSEQAAPPEQAAQSIDYDLLLQIAQAYQTVRARDPAVALYGKLLDRAKQQQNVAQQQQILTALADLHLSWFDYTNAANTYQEILTLARSTGNQANEITALQQLGSIYQQNNQPEQAIDAEKQLVEIYQKQQNFVPIPALKLALGDNYRLLNRLDLAATSYQEAFATARSVQQYAYAEDALQKLAELYQAANRPDDALVVYQLLLDVNRQSYNTFGMMNTYDQLGQLYKARGNSSQALTAFRQGLQLAQQLKYRVDYFNSQIQQVGQ